MSLDVPVSCTGANDDPPATRGPIAAREHPGNALRLTTCHHNSNFVLRTRDRRRLAVTMSDFPYAVAILSVVSRPPPSCIGQREELPNDRLSARTW